MAYFVGSDYFFNNRPGHGQTEFDQFHTNKFRDLRMTLCLRRYYIYKEEERKEEKYRALFTALCLQTTLMGRVLGLHASALVDHVARVTGLCSTTCPVTGVAPSRNLSSSRQPCWFDATILLSFDYFFVWIVCVVGIWNCLNFWPVLMLTKVFASWLPPIHLRRGWVVLIVV